MTSDRTHRTQWWRLVRLLLWSVSLHVDILNPPPSGGKIKLVLTSKTTGSRWVNLQGAPLFTIMTLTEAAIYLSRIWKVLQREALYGEEAQCNCMQCGAGSWRKADDLKHKEDRHRNLCVCSCQHGWRARE